MFLNKKSKYSALIIISFFLFACGGGGGGDSTSQSVDSDTVVQSSASEETASQTASSAVALESSSEQVVTRAADLSVPAGFDFSTGYPVYFSASLAQRNSETVFITLCSEYTQTGEEYDVDYQSCLLKVSVTDGFFSETLFLTNDKQALVAVLWFFDGSDPLYIPWTKDGNQDGLQQFSISQ
ncbi:hypothetical protein [Psychromonas sp.]|uniref:hypothetical protein n=1 Tax=Psychromonas sp. TaxID=1884585 RepID=UPI00356B3BA3